MSDTVTPTSTANASSTAIANEVVPESKAAVWRIATAAGIAIAAAAAQVVATALPGLVDAGVALIPPGFAWLVPAVKIGAASVAAWLLKTANAKHKDSVITALHTDPPKAMEKFYTTK